MTQQEEEELEGNLKALQKANQALQKEKLVLQAEICALQQAAKIGNPIEVKIKVRGGGSRDSRICLGIKTMGNARVEF